VTRQCSIPDCNQWKKHVSNNGTLLLDKPASIVTEPNGGWYFQASYLACFTMVYHRALYRGYRPPNLVSRPLCELLCVLRCTYFCHEADRSGNSGLSSTISERLDHLSLSLKVPDSNIACTGLFQKLSLFTQQGIGTQLFLELGKVKMVRKRQPASVTTRLVNMAL